MIHIHETTVCLDPMPILQLEITDTWRSCCDVIIIVRCSVSRSRFVTSELGARL
eukprot:m.902380 g.902380  ORF g.902380 m.902380 type:complete len:54 (+) comp23689_c3_seq57:262-423(+)